MVEHTGLIAAICEDADDDQVRLVYADWLEERGDPRGELIRLEIEVARMAPRDLRREGLRRRDQELLALHSESWRLPRLAGVTWGRYERGFIESVTLETWQAFVAHVDQIASLVPLRSLTIEGVLLTTGQISVLAAWPRLGRLTALSLKSSGLGEEETQRLVGSTYLANLKELSLEDNLLRDGGAEHLAGCSFLCGLSKLNVAQNQIRSAGISALRSSLYLHDLIDLDLTGNEVG